MKKILLISLGFLSTLLGTIGMFLPVMPTTIFLLIAAWCFGRSSPKFLKWLETNKLFGSYLSNYRLGLGITMGEKIFTLVFLWLGLGVSAFFVSKLWVRLLLATIGVGVTLHILTIKTRIAAEAGSLETGPEES